MQNPTPDVGGNQPAWIIAGLALLAALGTGAFAFADLDRMSTFADDTVSYMLLAQCWSPWFPASEVVMEACPSEHHPPLFSLLLAWTGASHSYLLAHRVYVVLFLLAVTALFLFVRQQLRYSPAALGVALLFAVAPITWTHMLSITSENLFILLSLAALMRQHQLIHKPAPTRRDGLLLGLLVGGLILTRSIGVSMAGAILVSGFLWGRERFANLGLIPFLTAILLAAAGFGLRTMEGAHLYGGKLGYLLEKAGEMGFSPSAWFAFSVPSLEQIFKSWFGFFTLYTTSATSPSFLLGAAFGLAALVGLVHRLINNRLDGWYALFNLGILVLWFFPGQYPRFIYAIGPVLLFHAVWGLRLGLYWLPTPRREAKLALLLLLPLAIAAPALTFFYQRAQLPSPFPDLDPAANAEFYRDPGLKLSTARALRHEALFRDMARLKKTTPPDARILWFTPGFLALLAERRGVRMAYHPAADWSVPLEIRAGAGADFIYLSELHPRDTRDHSDGLRQLPHFTDSTTPVWTSGYPGQPDKPFGILLKVNQPSPR